MRKIHLLAFLFSFATISMLSFAATHAQTQILYLDFESGNPESPVLYDDFMQEEIVFQIQDIYQRFDIEVTRTEPISGPFSTVTFNSGAPGGRADSIDFRNLNRSELAFVNVDTLVDPGDTFAVIAASTNIGAHEAGHLLGLRHFDALGPIGSGLVSDRAERFTPVYPGPTFASETFDHLLISGASTGSVNGPTGLRFLSERSAIKLTLNEVGVTTLESGVNNDSLPASQSVEFENYTVPNTILFGGNAGLGDFDVDAFVVVGDFDSSSDSADYFSFEGLADDLINIEALTNGLGGRVPIVDINVSLFDSSGEFVDYYGTDAFNEDGPEGVAAQLIDLRLPEDGTYFVKVDTRIDGDTGGYELFVNRFNGVVSAVPEPNSFLILAGASMFGVLLRRKQ